MRAFRSHAHFADIGTPRDYLETCLALAGAGGGDGRARSRSTPTATLDACVVWDDVRIGRGARLRRVVVGNGVEVPDGYHAEGVVIVNGRQGLDVTPLD